MFEILIAISVHKNFTFDLSKFRCLEILAQKTYKAESSTIVLLIRVGIVFHYPSVL
jgi:hypothetical protein